MRREAERTAGRTAVQIVHRTMRRRAGDPLRETLRALEAEGYRVLSNTRARTDSIDHIVIGPGGVFTVERNEWGGRFSLREDGWFRHSRREDAGIVVWTANQHVMAVKAKLRAMGIEVPVHGLVALTAGRVSEGAIEMGRVLFVPATHTARYIRSRHRSMSSEQIDLVAEAILRGGVPGRTRPQAPIL